MVAGAALAGPPPDDTTTTTTAPETTTTTTSSTSTSAPETTTTAPGSTQDQGEGDVGALIAYQVTDGDDSGGGSYRQAILDANNDVDPVVIDFAPGLTVNLTSADVVYTNTEPIILNGNGSTINGGDAHQILDAANASSVTVNDLTLRDGETTGAGGAIETGIGQRDINAHNSAFIGNTAGSGGGGAVATVGGNITITDSTFSGNTAVTGGGALTIIGSFIISGSTFSGNGAASDGGGAYTPGFGAYTITNSTFSGNTAGGDGAGAYTVGTGSYAITNSTFSGNVAGGDGGGVRGAGGTTTTVTNSTFSGNGAADGAAIFTGGGSVSFAYATVLSNTSVTSNVFAGVVTSFGSVVALSGGGTNCGGPSPPVTTSHGWNFSDETSCGFTNTGRGDNQAAGNNPQLGALADNGGPTPTHRPQLGSPLLNVIPGPNCQDFKAAGVTTDQRGVARPQFDACDIGAVELTRCPGPAQASAIGVPSLAGAEGAVAVAPLGLQALFRRRRRLRMVPRRARVRSVVTWLMVAGVAVAVLAACQPVKKAPPTFC